MLRKKTGWHSTKPHPPIQKRIDAIDPHAGTKQKVRDRGENKTPSLYSVGNGSKAMPLSSDSTTQAVLSDKAAVALTDVASCVAVLHAIFVSADPQKSKLYYQAISFAYNKVFAHHKI